MRFFYYYGLPIENCWHILFSDQAVTFGLRSSRLIAISKETGKVIFDGSANDEG